MTCPRLRSLGAHPLLCASWTQSSPALQILKHLAGDLLAPKPWEHYCWSDRLLLEECMTQV